MTTISSNYQLTQQQPINDTDNVNSAKSTDESFQSLVEKNSDAPASPPPTSSSDQNLISGNNVVLLQANAAYETPADIQGVASYTDKELSKLGAIYDKGKKSDEYTVIKRIISNADKALGEEPKAVKDIVTSGDSAKSGDKSNSSLVGSQSDKAYNLALAYEISGNEKYLKHARKIMLEWAETNKAEGNSIANEGLIKMFKGYDMVRENFSPSDREKMDSWMRDIADAVIKEQANAKKKGSMTSVNNHRSFALLEIGTIGAVLNEPKYINYVTDNFLDHVGKNLNSFEGQPKHLGVDYNERRAIHYVAYNMEAMTQLAVLMDRFKNVEGNPYEIDYNPYSVKVDGASISATMKALIDYASGEKESNNEYKGSEAAVDKKRLESGVLSRKFDPADAIPALEAASYFTGSIKNESDKRFNLASVTAGIIKADKGKLSLPSDIPSTNFLLNSISSPHRE